MTKRSKVDIVVVGGGAAGLVAAAGTAALGARTVLVERDRLGGECTWTGCVPSKALLHIAKQAHAIRVAGRFGINAGDLNIDFQAAIASVRAVRQRIYDDTERPARLKQLGIQPLQASGRFIDARTMLIERGNHQREIAFRSAIIATGSRPAIPDIPGLAALEPLTTDTLFELNRLPGRLVILGGGATGVEMAQAFARLGSAVSLITRDVQLIPGVDADAADLLRETLRNEGIEIYLRSTIVGTRLSRAEQVLQLDGDTGPYDIIADRLLLATGRMPNTAGLGLEAAGVDYQRQGIPVDDWCRTKVRHIFATGDVTTQRNLTNVAEEMSKTAAFNALTRLPLRRFERRAIPMVVYTDPEIATVGRTAQDLDEMGIDHDRIHLPYEAIDRAVIEGGENGFVRVYHRRGQILGATIAGAMAGELITTYALAMQHRLRLHQLAQSVYPYPTMMLGTRRAADQIVARSLQPWMVRAFRKLYSYNGTVPEYIGTDDIV